MPSVQAVAWVSPATDECLLDEEFDVLAVDPLCEEKPAVGYLRLCDDIEWDECEDVIEGCAASAPSLVE